MHKAIVPNSCGIRQREKIGEQSTALTEWQKAPGFIDVFRAANPGVSGGTIWQNIYVDWPTTDRRVDFIFLLGDGSGNSPVVHSSALAFDQPGRLPNGDALWPSDHRGVVAEIEFLSPSPVAAISSSRPTH